MGGHSTKIHCLCDSIGLPIRFLLSGGEVHDSRMAQALFDGLFGQHLLADKGYDSADFVADLRAATPSAAAELLTLPRLASGAVPDDIGIILVRPRRAPETH